MRGTNGCEAHRTLLRTQALGKAEMEAATGRQKDMQPTDGGGAPSVTSQGEEESYRSGASPQSTTAGMSGTANTANTMMTAPAPNAEVTGESATNTGGETARVRDVAGQLRFAAGGTGWYS